MRRHVLRACLLLSCGLAFAVLAGCGQKGPLYMPSAAPPPAKPQPVATPSPAPPASVPSSAEGHLTR